MSRINDYGHKWTDLKDKDKEDSTGGWILFRSGVISGQKTGTQGKHDTLAANTKQKRKENFLFQETM